MSKKVIVYNMLTTESIDVQRVFSRIHGGGIERLALIQCDGLYYLVPHEIMSECLMVINQRERNKNDLNILSPITIGIQQCIPIPSETAKILLEL